VRQVRSERSRRRLWLAAGVAIVVALGACTGWLLIKGARGAEIATVLGLPVAVLSLLAAVLAVMVRSVNSNQAAAIDPSVATAGSASLVALVDDLAAAVAIQWRDEQIPDPLPVRWTRTSRAVADHRERIIPDDASDDFSELTGQWDEVAEFFSTLPSRRLVVLGDSGTGKTGLAIQLLLSLLQRRRPGEPVPVLLPISNWDPATLSVADWLAAELTVTYPALGIPVTDRLTRAAALLRDGLLVPILDGFDEMPEQVRPRALRRLNEGLGTKQPLVLTSRGEQYQKAVHDPGGRVLSFAAVVELHPLRGNEVSRYLRLATAPQRLDKWKPVSARLADQPDGPLARALSTPLMAWLVRSAYAEGTANPVQLLEFTDQHDIENHLIEQFIPTVYDPDWAEDCGPEPTATRRPLQPTPQIEKAQQWLAFLAGNLRHTGTTELAWWRLERSAPRSVMAFLGGAIFALILGFAVGVPSGLAYDISTALSWGLITVLVAGLAGGLTLYVAATSQESVPAVARLRHSRARSTRAASTPRRSPLLRHLAEGLAVGSLSGVGVGLLVTLVVMVARGFTPALTSGITAAVAVMLAVALSRTLDFWLNAPVDLMTATSPAEVLRGARTSALTQGIAGGLAFGLAFGLTRGAIIGIVAGMAAGLSRCLVAGLDQGWSKVSLTAWSRYLLARLWLAADRKLPWRFNAFLRDAHYRGVLRQVGAVYQFRHDQLADCWLHSSVSQRSPLPFPTNRKLRTNITSVLSPKNSASKGQ
jgi:GTPase SAR1 family protein